MSRPRFGFLLMVTAYFFFSLQSLFVKMLQAPYSVHEITILRFLFVIIFLTPYMFKNKIPLLGHNRKTVFIRSFGGWLAVLCTYWAISRMPLAEFSLLSNTFPLFVALISAVFIGEKSGWRLLLRIFLGLLGCVFILKPGFNIHLIPGLAVLAGTCSSAAAHVGIRHSRHSDSPLTIVWNFSFFSILASAIFSISQWQTPNSHDMWIFLGIGGVAFFAQLFATYAYQFDVASRISSASYFSILFALFWGWYFFQETPGPLTFLGAAFLIGAGGVEKVRFRSA